MDKNIEQRLKECKKFQLEIMKIRVRNADKLDKLLITLSSGAIVFITMTRHQGLVIGQCLCFLVCIICVLISSYCSYKMMEYTQNVYLEEETILEKQKNGDEFNFSLIEEQSRKAIGYRPLMEFINFFSILSFLFGVFSFII